MGVPDGACPSECEESLVNIVGGFSALQISNCRERAGTVSLPVLYRNTISLFR